jgi:hypothetical protein
MGLHRNCRQAFDAQQTIQPTDIPVHLSPGKYILKSVDPKTGAITVIAKRLNIKDIYMLKAEENKDCIYWFHRI